MALNKNLIHVCKDQRFNVSNNRYKVCLIFHFNKKVFICFYIVDLKILTYRLTKPFNIKKQLPLLQKDPDQLTSQPCSHWPVMWLQKVLRLQYPIHLYSQYFPYHPWEHAVEGKFAFTILIYFKPVVKRLNDRLFIIYLSKENVLIVQIAPLQPGLHDKQVPLCNKHVLSAQCAGQGVTQLLPYTPNL